VGKLKNPRRECFVQERIKGKSQRQAYLTAYPSSKKWKDESVDTAAFKLAKTAEVLHRFEELREQRLDRAIDEGTVGLKEVIERLTDIGFTDTTEFARIVGREHIDSLGNVRVRQSVELTPTDEIPKNKRVAIAGIKQGVNGIEVKVHDQVKTLVQLAGVLERTGGASDDDDNDDGFLEAMKGEAGNIWGDDDE
jgi:phage terminase small subunit